MCLSAAAQESTWLTDRPEVWQTLIAYIESSDPIRRIAGYNELSRIASLDDPAYSNVLFNLLDKENRYRDDLGSRGEYVGEGWSEPYYTGLIDTCKAAYDRAPTEERFRRLAAGSYNPGSPFAAELAKTAGSYIDWLVTMAVTDKNKYMRINAIGVLSAWVLRDEGTSAQRSLVWRSVGGGLRDQSDEVQGATIYLLERSGRKEALARIEEAIADKTSTGADLRWMEPRLRRAATNLRAKIAQTPPRP